MTEKKNFVHSRIKLTIGILVSNRIEYIEKVMLGVKPLIDSIPSELIAVDTVGAENSDGSVEVVRRFTDKVFRFEWCNDFAKARNVCLEHASGEWFMFLDDDEVFEDVGEIVDFFRSGECDQYRSGIYHLKNHLADGTERMSVVLRLIRRKPDTHFVGRIHEGFNEVYEPCKLFNAYVHHYGYMFATDESVKKHQERNLSIIREEITANGLDAGMAAQLVQELIFTNGTENEGYKELQNSLAMLSEDELKTSSGQWLLTAGVSYFYNLGRHEEALEEDKRIREKYSLNETSRLVLAGTCVYSAAHLEMADECIKYAKEYAELYEILSCNTETAIRQMNLGTENYRQKEYAESVIPLGVHACVKAGRYDDGVRLLIKMRDLGLDIYAEYVELVDVVLLNSRDEEIKKVFYSNFLSDAGMKAYGYE